MRRKRNVYARTLAEAYAYDKGRLAGGPAEYAYGLTFEEVHGVAGLQGRESVVTMSGSELATAIGAIPALSIEDPEDMKALVRVQNLLRNARPRRAEARHPHQIPPKEERNWRD
jgi:hypothetical protein